MIVEEVTAFLLFFSFLTRVMIDALLDIYGDSEKLGIFKRKIFEDGIYCKRGIEMV
ncbi:hypothetical protein HNQ34_003102 [Anoxybacillus tepidamans]|uniref:Uncharacterized protein n=1 Tax=Anoxybacteroides tepidamans TaxID=265948 RepID=A0A7W8MXU5_9BACL|nr:hypothetical protein [Anoxybacillus tepidamans]